MTISTFLFFVVVGVLGVLFFFLRPTLDSAIHKYGHASIRAVAVGLAFGHFIGMICILLWVALEPVQVFTNWLGIEVMVTITVLAFVGANYFDIAQWIEADCQQRKIESHNRIQEIIRKNFRALARRPKRS